MELPKRITISYVCFGAAALFYLSSLFLPCIVYKLLNGVDSYKEALDAVNSGAICWASEGDVKLTKMEGLVTGGRSSVGSSYHDWYCNSADSRNAPKITKGLELLYSGWAGLFIGNIAWYANVLGLMSLLALRQSLRKARKWAVWGFLLSLISFTFRYYPLDESGMHYLLVDHLGIGFYVWELAFIALIIALFLIPAESISQKAV